MARRRRSRGKKQRNQAILNFVLAGLAVAIIGFSFYALQPEPYDELTLCEISDDLPPHTAVIIDKTDEYSAQQSTLIAAVIRRARNRLDIGERFTLFELDQYASSTRAAAFRSAILVAATRLTRCSAIPNRSKRASTRSSTNPWNRSWKTWSSRKKRPTVRSWKPWRVSVRRMPFPTARPPAGS